MIMWVSKLQGILYNPCKIEILNWTDTSVIGYLSTKRLSLSQSEMLLSAKQTEKYSADIFRQVYAITNAQQ